MKQGFHRLKTVSLYELKTGCYRRFKFIRDSTNQRIYQQYHLFPPRLHSKNKKRFSHVKTNQYEEIETEKESSHKTYSPLSCPSSFYLSQDVPLSLPLSNSNRMISSNNQSASSPELKYFLEITKIPRGSGHEEKIREYLISYAKKNKFEYHVDDVGNLIIRKGTPKITLQAHMDMVQTSDHPFDFNTRSIEPLIKDGWITATGTTLGADDGTGLSICLVMLDTVPDIECLFTVEEETSMKGAYGITAKELTGTSLLNLDSSSLSYVIVGSAGFCPIIAKITPVWEPAEGTWNTLTVSGLLSGHSGLDIGLPRANAIKVAAGYLNSCKNLRIASFTAGNAGNVIPQNATVIFSGDAPDPVEYLNSIKECYPNETTMKISLTLCSETPKTTWTKAFTSRIIDIIQSAHTGVFIQNEQGVQSSANLAIISQQNDNSITVLTTVRSNINMNAVIDWVKEPLEKRGVPIIANVSTPIWNANINSPLVKTAKEIVTEITGIPPHLHAIHAGLECAVFQKICPHMPIVSIGPLIIGEHSPKERLNLTEFRQACQITEKIIAKLG